MDSVPGMRDRKPSVYGTGGSYLTVRVPLMPPCSWPGTEQ